MARGPHNGDGKRPARGGLPVAGDEGLLAIEASRLLVRDGAKKERAKRALCGVSDEAELPPPSVVEAAARGKVGICCSGGGIRSAAFNLGALQILQRRGVFQNATYLAAVSGGSYIASAFVVVAQRDPKGSAEDLITAERPPFYRGSPEEQYLRNRSSYMAPGAGGKLRLLQQVLMGLFYNLLFIALFLTPVALLLTIGYAHALPDLAGEDPSPSLPRGFWLVPVVLAGLSVVLGLLRVGMNLRKEWLRAAVESWSRRLLLIALVVAFFTLALPLLVDLVDELKEDSNSEDTKKAIALGPAAGIATIIAGVLVQLRSRVADPARVLESVTTGVRAFRKAGRGLQTALVYFAGAVVGPLLLLAFLVVLLENTLGWSADGNVNNRVFTALAASTGLFAFIYATADLTSWSLHPFYKRRLWSAFSTVRVSSPEEETPEGATPVGEARERDPRWPVKISDSHVKPSDSWKVDTWPTLIVCAAANISDTSATPPGRSVTSFTFSATTTGGPLVGAVGTSHMENNSHRRDLDLMAAVAMSGAAVSPSMGKMTKAPLRFLMALANVRLGVWVPNPRWSDRWPLKYRTRPRPWYLLYELLGHNQLNAPFLYVTDGGHYENLGLVELLRRGCTDVYCFDASGGDSFAQLGDAIALARSELGVEIDIDPQALVPKGERNLADTDCVRGTITYPTGETGTLAYARTVMTAGAPWDVHAYHDADKTFPHNPTSDQLYTDQKFEAYRVLGDRAARTALRVMKRAADRDEAAPLPQSPTGWAPDGPQPGGQPVAPASNHAPVAGGV